MQVQIIVVVRPLQFSAKHLRITAQHVPRDRELKQVKGESQFSVLPLPLSFACSRVGLGTETRYQHGTGTY